MTFAVEGLQISVAGRALVHEVSFVLAPGRLHALVGASGSGKSLTGMALSQVLPGGLEATARRVELNGVSISLGAERSATGLCFVPQDASLALNPVLTIGAQLLEAAMLNSTPRAQAHQLMLQQLTALGFDDAELRCSQYPHQLSGGMRQRALLAAALLTKPKVLMADEPTSALDASVRMRLFHQLKSASRECLLLLMTHDLAIAKLCDDVTVMHEGRVVEQGATVEVLGSPNHDYTRALLAAHLGPL